MYLHEKNNLISYYAQELMVVYNNKEKFLQDKSYCSDAQTFWSHVNKPVVRATDFISLLVFRIVTHVVLVKVQVQPVIIKEKWSAISLIFRVFLPTILPIMRRQPSSQ